MIKLIAMGLYVVIGLVLGGLFYRTFDNGKLTLATCLVFGVLGAFAGLFMADLADVRLFGNLIDSLIFSSIGSIILLGFNLAASKSN